MYLTLTGADNYMGIESFKIGQELTLKKDHDNRYDDEAIMVLNESGTKVAYVANSVNTVARGTHSAGYFYNSFKEETKCKVLFITDSGIIAETE